MVNNQVRFDLRLTIDELCKALPVWCVGTSVVVQSEPGCGKSTLLPMIAEANGDQWRKAGDNFPDDKYDYIYVDCPLRDVMDMGAFIPDRDLKRLEYYVGQLLKPESKKPKVIMLDEMMKSAKMMMTMFTRLLLEKVWGEVPLPEGSMIFATSNNQSDNVGDSLMAHAGNRVTIVQMAKPNARQWGAWASDKGISRVIRAWVAMNERALASYLDGGQEDNPYIFKPGNKVLSFVSPRSLHKADHIIKNSNTLGGKVTKAGLAGTIGISAAESIDAFMRVEKELINTEQVLSDPENIPVPESTAALCMMMFNAVDDIQTQDELSAFMKFVERIKSSELQNIFYCMMMKTKRTVKLAQNNEHIKKWAISNYDMLG